jgi:hypothetical protein
MTVVEARALIDEIGKLNYKLSDWEKQFIESISTQVTFTPKQAACLIRLYKKAAGGDAWERRKII